MVAWLRRKGVATGEPWTRYGVKGRLYFRDPSGNLFEIDGPKIDDAAGVARGAKQGCPCMIDFAGLNCHWNG